MRVAEGLARQGFRCYLPNWPLGSHTIPVNDGAELSPRGVATMIRDFIEARRAFGRDAGRQRHRRRAVPVGHRRLSRPRRAGWC